MGDYPDCCPWLDLISEMWYELGSMKGYLLQYMSIGRHGHSAYADYCERFGKHKEDIPTFKVIIASLQKAYKELQRLNSNSKKEFHLLNGEHSDEHPQKKMRCVATEA